MKALSLLYLKLLNDREMFLLIALILLFSGNIPWAIGMIILHMLLDEDC